MAAHAFTAILAAALAPPSACVILSSSRPSSHSHGDCSAVQRLAAKQRHTLQRQLRRVSGIQLPGAGMNPEGIEPFVEIWKDGFYAAGCVDDDMYVHGDKFGHNKVKYTREDSNVSIVHYTAHVKEEERKLMTYEVCFSFCRSIQDMNFFGIRNGRDCYCTPYYVSVEGEDSTCDSVCEGDGTRMCGGETKSSVFGMHSCTTAADDLADADGALSAVMSELGGLDAKLRNVTKTLQSTATEYQHIFGDKGDPAAADLMQAAKVEAGKLDQSAVDVARISDSMTKLSNSSKVVAQDDFSRAAVVRQAEKLIVQIQAEIRIGKVKVVELTSLLSEAAPKDVPGGGTSKAFYPVLYFVDKNFSHVPSTCSGTLQRGPFLGTYDTCADECNKAFRSCVGFSYFPSTGGPPSGGLCFLLSALRSTKYYAGCKPAGAAFFQQHMNSAAVNATQVQCMAKFSAFQGSTLKPDPSGKCKLCLKEAKKSDRCFV